MILCHYLRCKTIFIVNLYRTTIPQAPVRQTRQPRKQEIKPVSERRDEEIIVQEVMISSNGFVENLNQKFKNKKLQVGLIFINKYYAFKVATIHFTSEVFLSKTFWNE